MARQSKKKPTTRQRRKILRPKTRNQENYMGQINRSYVTFCSGPAGSGKTSVSVGMACEYLIEKKVDKIIITRPVVLSPSIASYALDAATLMVPLFVIVVLVELFA